MDWKDTYLDKAEELQREGGWTGEDKDALRQLVFHPAFHKAVGIILVEGESVGARLLHMGLGSQEEVVKAARVQGEVSGMMRFQERLLDLAETEEDKDDGP